MKEISPLNSIHGAAIKEKVNEIVPQVNDLNSNKYLTITEAAYTLYDANKDVTLLFTSSSSITVTVPSTLGADFRCSIVQAGTGDITLSGSVNGVSTLNNQYGRIDVVKLGNGSVYARPAANLDASVAILQAQAAGTTAMSGALINSANVGAASGNATAVEYGDGSHHITELTLASFVIGALAGAGANLALGNLLYTFPAGVNVIEVSVLSELVLTAAGTAVNTDTGLGSTQGSGAQATLNAVASTAEDYLTGQTIGTDPSGGTAVNAILEPTAGAYTGIAFQTSSTAMYLNSAGAWNANNTGNLTASGRVIIKWMSL